MRDLTSLIYSIKNRLAALVVTAAALVSDTAYDATTWNSITTVAHSKNAVRDKFEALTQTFLRVAHCKYDFAVDGGVQGTIAPANSDTIPDNAIIVGGTINSTTAVTSDGAATVGVGTAAGSSTTAIKAATAKASLSADAVLNAVPTLAVPVKLTAAGAITFTIGAADLTAGVIEVWVYYVVAAA